MRGQKCDGLPPARELESGVEEAGVLSDWWLKKKAFSTPPFLDSGCRVRAAELHRKGMPEVKLRFRGGGLPRNVDVKLCQSDRVCWLSAFADANRPPLRCIIVQLDMLLI